MASGIKIGEWWQWVTDSPVGVAPSWTVSVSYVAGPAKSTVDYIIARQAYKSKFHNVKVISNEECVPKHTGKLLVMDMQFNTTSHQQRLQSSSLPHSSSASHPPLRVSRWCKDSGKCDGVVPAGLLQLHPVWHIFVQPQQTTARAECPSTHCHDDEKMRSHYTGVSQSALARCYCPHSVQNCFTDIQDTHDSSAKLHWRPTPAAPLVTTTQVLRSQPAWNSLDENRFRTMQLHLQCCTHLEHYLVTSLATWMLL